MLTVVVILQFLLLLLLGFILLRLNRPVDHGDELAKRIGETLDGNFREGRGELQAMLTAGREEAGRHAAAQNAQIRNAFNDFMKFLMEFRDGVRQAEKTASLQLSEGLRQDAERRDGQFSRLAAALEENITRLKTAMQEENRNARKEQLEFQTRFQTAMRSEMEASRKVMDTRLQEIRVENAAKLDQMKQTVDEKLQSSMAKHFNESFKLISERLEQVHKGLGEMQTLASGVGDLKKVLTNVKSRGNLGEIQLSAILEQYLAPDQYVMNVSTVPNSRELVEFAIKLPGQSSDRPVLMPVDSKFPVEDFQRLMDLYEKESRMSPEVRHAQELFARTVRKCAQDIHDKYIYPPVTTPFGLMFVPSEGIYAEILRVPGLFESLQSDFQISVAGPTNLVAFLNSLQLGFKTLAIEKRSNEVWTILGAVKSEFSKFGDEMEATRKSLQSVVNHVEKIGTRSRALERQLRDVTLPEGEIDEVTGAAGADHLL